ncbi:MAG TPA: alpha-glucan family phosphorylase [Tepidisphaeraceae bacterium]|nr:alpha-glucan family phosphorylase [Tepidisphaeraceae bacterium]
MTDQPTIAYFSMEIGLEAGMPTYSGGLGILAGDTIRSAADLRVPLAAVTLLHRKGYFYQWLDPAGLQHEEPVEWVIEDYLQELPERVVVKIEDREVHLRCWKYEVKGISDSVVPVYFLDSDLPENAEQDRKLTDYLYGGDQYYRLCQEVILGIGGVRMLRALGYQQIIRFHMNEGHAALLTLELLEEHAHAAGHGTIDQEDVEAVRRVCVFTTHTAVPAGHDQFPMDLVHRVFGHHEVLLDWQSVIRHGNLFNMTYLALNLSSYINGVAKRHGEVSRLMFAQYTIDSITNGVHAATWISEPFQRLFDQHIPDWRRDNFSFRYALNIPRAEIWNAHVAVKKSLVHYVNRETNAGIDADILTLGFARRAAAYKRGDLLFHDLDRLRSLVATVGPFQVVFSGKAHPRDQEGKHLIQRIIEASHALKGQVRIAYLQNYDMDLARMITAGVDIWLNTPQVPLEASGTSGMKAALNGVPQFGTLDGWWIEGHIEGVTGWAIGGAHNHLQATSDLPEAECRARDAASLYQKLQDTIIPLYYRNRDGFIDIMRHAIGLNGSFFNTQRMMQQYVVNAYFG